jgi:glycosyltransferase involved in cell wall biosynthesis
MSASEKLAVVVPAYNEPSINKTLEGLYSQYQRESSTHHFIVDNASTDDTRARIESFMQSHDDFPMTILEEPQKGTGATADTGFKAAISKGFSIIARTDSDTIPTPTWTLRISDNFHSDTGLQLLGGKSSPLKDESYRFGDELLLPAAVSSSRYVLALKNLDPRYLKVAIGHNMATRSAAYENVGGFTRSSIDEIDEDTDYSLKVIDEYGYGAVSLDPKVEVHTSMRRIRKYGVGGTALHHLFPQLRKYRKSGVDVR